MKLVDREYQYRILYKQGTYDYGNPERIEIYKQSGQSVATSSTRRSYATVFTDSMKN